MSMCFYILMMGITNALRGAGIQVSNSHNVFNYLLSRPVYMAIMTINTMALLIRIGYYGADIGSAIYSLAIFISLLVGFSAGWGKYLNVAFPNMKYVDETEVKLIDDITTKIYKVPANEKEFSRWCLIAMSIRGLLFYPVFIVLAFANLYALIFGLGMALLGAIYWARRFVPESISIRVAEFTTGCLLGGLIWLSLIF